MTNGKDEHNKVENSVQDWGSSMPSMENLSEGIKTVKYHPSPPDNVLNRTMIFTLSLLSIFGVIASVMLPMFEQEVSDFLISITSACVGALVMSVRSWKN